MCVLREASKPLCGAASIATGCRETRAGDCRERSDTRSLDLCSVPVATEFSAWR